MQGKQIAELKKIKLFVAFSFQFLRIESALTKVFADNSTKISWFG